MDYLQFKRVYSNDLLHFGIKRRSGRYPYGSGERPYQNDPKGKKIKRKDIEARDKEEKAARDRITYNKKEFRDKEEKRRFLDTVTNATEILQYRDQLTQRELQDALDRVKTIRELSSISKKEIDAAWDVVDDAMKKVGKVKNWAKTGVESAEVIQDIIKLLSGVSEGQKQQPQKKKK